MSLDVAEADLEAAQKALDENGYSRPAQVDYEGKLAVYEDAVRIANAQPNIAIERPSDEPIYEAIAADQPGVD